MHVFLTFTVQIVLKEKKKHIKCFLFYIFSSF